MALAFDGAVEGAHMGHPDFRAHGRVFASLHADRTTGTVALPPEEQARFVDTGDAFSPESGAWGRQGYTRVMLATVDEELLGEAMTLAWRYAAARGAKTRRAGDKAQTPKPKAQTPTRKRR
jgi:hypothetical protein